MSAANPRRQFLKTATVAAGTVVAGSWPQLASAATGIQFPQSVASGDPRTNSVILWTRAVNLNTSLAGDLSLTLQVSTDSAFSQLVVSAPFTAKAAFDGCLRVRVTGLQPDTRYYYRFAESSSGAVTRTGRTRTAPLANTDRTVRFAFVSCQDYVGRYYNAYLRLLQADMDNLDFVVHLGDYIYETTGDPSFQKTAGRGVVFQDKAGALTLGAGTATYQAAASLDNYRDLYRTYRSDTVLQQIHERFAMIAIWDDHEFSDDCHGATATYYDGATPETDANRRRHSEQAYFEYMPIDPEGGAQSSLEVDPAKLYPNNRIYRDFRYGQHLHLVMTDTRSYRPDHLIPEEAYPGQVAVEKTSLMAALGALAGGTAPASALYAGVAAVPEQRALYAYIDLRDNTYAQVRQTLKAVVSRQYLALGLGYLDAMSRAEAATNGPFSLWYANKLLSAAGLTQLTAPTDAPLGISYIHLGKQKLYDKLGARYMVIKAAFDLFAVAKGLENPAGQNLFGAEQTQWAVSTFQSSNATWQVLGSSISFAPLVLDLSNIPGVPAELKQTFYLNVEHWDGFPVMKQATLSALSGLSAQSGRASVIIAGDIHASYVSEHPGTVGNTICFTGPSVSSGTFGEFVRDTATSIDPNLAGLATQIDSFLKAGSSSIRYARSNASGVVVVDAKAGELIATYHLLPVTASDGKNLITESYYDRAAALVAQMQTASFRVSGTQLQAL